MDEHKLNQLDKIMQALRTEWFVWEVTKPEEPKNINQIKQLCERFIKLVENE